MLGLSRVGAKQKVFGAITLRIARDAPCATIMLGRRPTTRVSRLPAAYGAQLYDRLFSRDP